MLLCAACLSLSSELPACLVYSWTQGLAYRKRPHGCCSCRGGGCWGFMCGKVDPPPPHTHTHTHTRPKSPSLQQSHKCTVPMHSSSWPAGWGMPHGDMGGSIHIAGMCRNCAPCCTPEFPPFPSFGSLLPPLLRYSPGGVSILEKGELSHKAWTVHESPRLRRGLHIASR